MCFIKYLLGPIEVIHDAEANIKTQLSLCAKGMKTELRFCTAFVYTQPDECAETSLVHT